MTRSTCLRRAGLATLLCGLFSFVGCGAQREGERCSLLNGNADCNAGLVCTAASNLRGGDEVDRCCPANLNARTDERCAPRGASGGTGGGGGEGGGTTDPGEGGSDSGSGGEPGEGAKCLYPSDCPENLTCGPTGRCQTQCKQDRDCFPGQVCTADLLCVAAE